VTVPDPVPLKVLQIQLKVLVDDLRSQSREVPELRTWLDGQYQAARASERTGATPEAWLDEQLDLAAVAWLLGTVFVRFCEDNDLISDVWLAGPSGRTDAAVQAQTAYFMKNPAHNDRHWILAAFSHLRELRATAGIFDEHNPVWRFPISGDAAADQLDFWRRGAGVHSFVDSRLDTRFLGDLYQDLSQEARKRYALLQTPEFVEEFILDLTLTPSLAEYGLEETSVIDPTCGSGHFLLDAFARLHERWKQHAPAMDPRVRVQKALDQVTGVDINPFAVAIAKFRLLVAALRACGEKSLESAPGFTIRLAVGDSLLLWDRGSAAHQGDLLAPLEGREGFAYFSEDADLLAKYLRPGQYTVAVGNPPYITVKDKVLNKRYRQSYMSCSGQWSLSVPFAERFFELTRRQDESGRAGFTGQITANSFMKREFGKRLIEDFLAGAIDLTHVIDTSGAYIPGHGTPTVILVGRRRLPRQDRVRAVLGVLGEPEAPLQPENGLVWTAIRDNIDRPGEPSPYVTVADLPRSMFSKHPWSLAGGGAGEVKMLLEKAGAAKLHNKVEAIGFMAVTREDDAYFVGRPLGRRLARTGSRVVPVNGGACVRDWITDPETMAIFPYSDDGAISRSNEDAKRLLWGYRVHLSERKALGGTQAERGLSWFEYSDFHSDRWASALILAFAFVATHNQFVLDREGQLFIRSAPVVKFPEEASEDDHLALLGLLNSSTACFWLKQVSHGKGNGGVNEGYRGDEWEEFFEFTSTKLEQFPIPERAPLELASELNRLAQELRSASPEAVCRAEAPTRQRLSEAREGWHSIRRRMIALQEELDWECYLHYGVLDEDLRAPADAVPELNIGGRAFEIVLARKMARGEAKSQWFARHGSTPITDTPTHWPEAYRRVVERRIRIIDERPDIALIERPECKRRWASTPWNVQEKEALKNWLLDRLEAERLWRDAGRTRVLSVAQLADRVGTDEDFRSVLTLYCRRDDYDIASELTKLVADEAVPFLAAYRYKTSGLRKREQWERTWDLQRREDKGEEVGRIDVPPKYGNPDFARVSYWRNRGKLDVPKERFVLYPRVGRDTDKTPVIGWAGWNHLDQAQALATLYITRKTEDGWPADWLLPLLAGLVELEPWLHQWYGDPAPGYTGSPAAFYTTLIDAELAALGYGRGDLVPEKLR
jgi:SAM-dependent methyltransferase